LQKAILGRYGAWEARPRGPSGVARRTTMSDTSGEARWDALTRAELKVVELVTEGLTNPEIARRLYVSPWTVQTHLKRVFKKLGVRGRAELAAWAARRAANRPGYTSDEG
jgi:DNA-binding CsgD family transcriptional regulator